MSKKKTRVTGKTIRRDYVSLLLAAVSSFVFGIYLISVIALNPTPDYEDLKNDTITVEHIEYHASGRGNGHYAMISSEGIHYILSGDCYPQFLKKELKPGTEISIKWYSDNYLIFKKFYIEEIVHDGEMLSVYSNHIGIRSVFMYICTCVVFVLGFTSLIVYRRNVRRETEKLPKKYRN